MARIYKESRYVLQLLIGKSYGAQYDDVKISFYTKNPNNQVMVDNGITIKRNIAEVKIESTLFDNLEEGLIKYIVYGTKDGIPFIEERQSNYFLKTPLDFKPGESGTTCNLGIGEYGFDSNSVGDYELYASDDGYDGWSKMFIHIYGDDGAISVRRASGLLDDFANNIEVLDFGWNYYVGGIITEIQEIYTLNGNYLGYATYILDNGFKIYRGKWISGNDFDSKDQIKVGAYAIVYGRLQNNNGELGLEEGSQVIAYQECGGGSCNLINPIVFSKEAGNTINAENVQIPTFVYEGNQYYNVDSFNLADIEEFKIHILFKPNNSGDAEPVNIFGCEDTDWDNTTFGARIYQGQITFKMSGQEVVSPYTENTWYDVEMGYNTTKRWFIVNGETLLETEHAFFNKPSQTLMIGAINSGRNAFRPFYGKIAAIYIESNGNQVWLLPKEDGTMGVYWNNRINSRNSISGDNNARFENDYISGDGMKSITWLGNLEDKWVTPSMSERDGNGYIVVSPSEGYNGLKRTVINPQTLYNEGYGQGKTDGVNEQKSKLESISITENGIYSKEDGYNHIEVNVIPKINIQEAGLKFSNSTFTEVPEWADFNGITDMSKMFMYCSNLQTIPMIDTSNVTTMGYMFSSCKNLQTIPLFDTSNVTNMTFMFSDCSNLQTIPLLNTSNVTDMSYMFNNCQNLQTMPLLNTSNVTDMSYMFILCRNLQTIPLIDTSNVTNMNNMFSDCNSLQTIPLINTSKVTDMSHMFYYCNNLQTIPQIDTSNVTNMNHMFNGCHNLQTLPKFNCQKIKNMSMYFCYDTVDMSSLTDVGGWENLSCNWDDSYGLAACPNLTHQSCINILNGLYDFVGNGSTETRTLKVHPNFLTTVGDEISIGRNKGWQITA